MKKLTAYFSRGELILWGSSSALILISFLIFDRENTMTLAAVENVSYLSVIICFVRYKLKDIEDAYHLFENKLDWVIKVAINP